MLQSKNEAPRQDVCTFEDPSLPPSLLSRACRHPAGAFQVALTFYGSPGGGLLNVAHHKLTGSITQQP